MPRSAYWNHNLHYQPVILNAVPPGCQTALDVGCGDGLLAARLAERCAQVTGIDRDPPMIATARAQAHTRMTFIEAAGGSLGDLQQVMGHADSRTTQRYGRARPGAGGPPCEVVAAYLAARRR